MCIYSGIFFEAMLNCYVWLKFLNRLHAYLNVAAKINIKKWTKEPITTLLAQLNIAGKKPPIPAV